MKILTIGIVFIVLYNACNQSQNEQKPQLERIVQSDFQWTGIAIDDDNRLFVNFPRWSKTSTISVAEIKDGKIVAFPDEKWNTYSPEEFSDSAFVCVQSVYIDDAGFLWILDPANPYFQGVVEHGPRLYKFDLKRDELIQIFKFPDEIIPPNSYLNDVRIDTKNNIAYITDSGTGGIVVLDLTTGKSVKRLQNHPSTQAEQEFLLFGQDTLPVRVHSDGIALSPDFKYVYYAALTGYTLYRIQTRFLSDFDLSEDELQKYVQKVISIEATDGMLFSDNYILYLGGIEKDAIFTLDEEGDYSLLIKNPKIRWADSFASDIQGNIYFTTSQIHLPPESRTKYEIYKIVN
jgi:sugar lactone lactonase YvrE